MSNETIAGRSSHRLKYGPIEERLLWLFINLDHDMLAHARTGVRDDTEDRLQACLRQIEDSGKQITKCLRLIENDPDPSPSLVTSLKRHEADKKAAEETLATLKVQAAKAVQIPVVHADLAKPETRRALRAEIAQHCQHIELFKDDFIVWFSERHGIRVNLVGDLAASKLVNVTFRPVPALSVC